MKCQGRPENGLCPDSRNDDTVHNTIADLFLCHACEAYRWPPDRTSKSGSSTVAARKQTIKSTSSSNNNCGRGKSNKETKKVSQQETSRATDAVPEVISAGTSGQHVASILAHYDKHGDSTNDHMCPICNESVADDEQLKFNECSCCKSMYNEHCTGLKSEVFQILLKIVFSTGWVCHQCQQNYAGLQSSPGKTAEELAVMRTSISWLYEELKCLKHTTAIINTVSREQPSNGVQYVAPSKEDIPDTCPCTSKLHAG